MSAVIEIEGVTKYYRGEKVLDNVSVSVERGEQLCLMGPGGAGKTLLIKIASGLVIPEEGTVRIEGTPIFELTQQELAEVRKSMGMLFQNYALFDFLTVEDNVAFPLRREGELSDDEITDRVNSILAEVNLPGINHQYPNELSGGMKKRVTFARAVIHQPPILFYDDPTMGLDPVTSSKIFIMLEKMKRENEVTSMCITHDVDGVKDICEKFVLLNKGELILHGTREEFEHSDIRLVRQFWDSEL
jgi:phospholipid/cholesterol/gamma-HCH transport system ATP-binding protein